MRVEEKRNFGRHVESDCADCEQSEEQNGF